VSERSERNRGILAMEFSCFHEMSSFWFRTHSSLSAARFAGLNPFPIWSPGYARCARSPGATLCRHLRWLV